MSNTPEEMFNTILKNPDAMNKIMGLMQSLGENNVLQEKKSEKEEKVPLPFGLDNPEILLKLGTAFQKISSDDDPRLNLITAIRPYLNPKRLRTADQAMQLLKLSKMSSLLEELKIL